MPRLRSALPPKLFDLPDEEEEEPTLGELLRRAEEQAQPAEEPTIGELMDRRQRVFREAAQASQDSPFARKSAELGLEGLSRALPAAEAIQENVLEPYVYEPSQAAAGLTSRAIRAALGDKEAYARQAESLKRTGSLYETAKEAYDTESIPLVTGLVEPLNLLPFPGPRALLGKGARAATKAAAKGAKEAAEAAAPAVREFAAAERGAIGGESAGFLDDLPLTETGGFKTPETSPTPLTPEELRQAVDAGVPLNPNPDEVRADMAAKGGKPPIEPPSGGGSPPSSPGSTPPPGSPLNRLHKMWDEAERQPTIGERLQAVRTSLPDRYRTWQERTTDRFAGINALSDDVEQTVARLGGVGDMQAQRASDIATTVKKALGAPWEDAGRHLDDYLHLKQAIDIETAKGPQRLIPGGIRGSAEAQQALNDLQGLLGPQRWEQLERAAAAAIQESQATLYRMVDSGLVSRELADALVTQYPHYNKQNIILAVEEEVRGVSKNRISVTSANLKRLTEYGTEQARTSPYASIIGSASDAEALIARNNTAKKVADEAVKQGLGTPVTGMRPVAQVEGEAIFRRPPGEIPGTMSYMEDGIRKLVEVPAWLEREAKAITAASDDVLIRSVSWVNALPRSAFVTYNPAWPAANLVGDYFAAAVTQGVTPLEELRGIVGAFRDILNNDPVLAQMRRSGGGQSGWFARSPGEVANIVRKSGNLAITDEQTWWDFAKSVGSAPFRATKAYGTALEQGTRRAVFTTALKRQGFKDVATAPTSALEKAAFEARRSTIDFQRAGDLSRAVNSVSVFFNAGIQGTLLPWRALRDSPRSRWALGTAVGANIGLYNWNRQFPEYADVPRDVKRGSMIIMLPSNEFDTQGRRKPNYVTIFPKVREWGLFFGTVNYALETLDGQAHEPFGAFLSQLVTQSTPVDAGLLTPTVPGQVAIEEMVNRDFYRDRPIVSPEQAGLEETEQYDSYTSETLKRIAQSIGLSPQRLQHVFYGVTGGAGRTATSITDPLLQSLNPTPMDFRIAEYSHELDEIAPPNVPPGEVALRRTEFLSSLSPKDREAVLELARRPENQIPVLSAMTRRFYNPRGGELYQIGQEAAAEATGKSAEQSSDLGRSLGKVSDLIDERQSGQDQSLLDKGFTPDAAKAWREAHSENGTLWRGSLLGLGIVFPQAAQLEQSDVWQDYQTKVYTLAGSVGDRRTKGQLLVAGYRAIPLEEIDPLSKDFNTFFQRRAEYKAALNPEDRALLERTLESTMTPVEKQYAKAQETLKPYWEAMDTVAELPQFKQRVQELRAAEQAQDTVRATQLKNTLTIAAYNRAVDREKERIRKNTPGVLDALRKWGYGEYKGERSSNEVAPSYRPVGFAPIGAR